MTALKNEFAKLKTGIYPKWHFCRHVIFLLQSFLCPDKSKMTNLLRIGLQAKYCQRFSSILPLDWQLKRHRLVWSRFINSMQIHIFMSTTNCYIWQNYLFQAIAITSQPWILILLWAICSIWKLGSAVESGIRKNQNLRGQHYHCQEYAVVNLFLSFCQAKYAIILRGQLFADQSKKLLTPTSICSLKFIATII